MKKTIRRIWPRTSIIAVTRLSVPSPAVHFPAVPFREGRTISSLRIAQIVHVELRRRLPGAVPSPVIFYAAASATKDLSRVFTPWSHAVALIYQQLTNRPQQRCSAG